MEERTLVANLVPSVSESDLKRLIESIQSELNLNISLQVQDFEKPREVIEVPKPPEPTPEPESEPNPPEPTPEPESPIDVSVSPSSVQTITGEMEDVISESQVLLIDVIGETIDAIGNAGSNSITVEDLTESQIPVVDAIDESSEAFSEVGVGITDAIETNAVNPTVIVDAIDESSEAFSEVGVGITDAIDEIGRENPTFTSPDMSSESSTANEAKTDTNGVSETQAVIVDAIGETTEAFDNIGTNVVDAIDTSGIFENIDQDILDALDSKNDDDKEGSPLKIGFSIVKDGFETGLGFLRMIFGIWSEFWTHLKKESPVLREVLSMFQSALGLIIGPIGTAIGMELIPILQTLYEDVYEITKVMWETYREEGISGMIRLAIEYAIPVFLDVARTAFELIPDDIPVISSIRDGIVYVMSWVIEHRDVITNILDSIVEVGNFLMKNLTIVVSLIAGFVTAYFASKVWDSIPFIGGALSAGTGALVMGAVAGGATYAGLTYIDSQKSPGYASGGYIPATPGGQYINVAEGGEGEYVIPESRVNSFADQFSDTPRSVTCNFYGFAEDELIRKIREVVNEESQMSALKGGF